MGDFKIILLSINKILLDKRYCDSCSQAPPLVKKIMDLCFSHFFHQLIAEPSKTMEHTKTFRDYILTNCTE